WPIPDGNGYENPVQPIIEERDRALAENTELRTISQQQQQELNTDSKTGLGNERKPMTVLENLAPKEDQKEASSLGLLMFDLDGFKEINDTLGHDFGDKILGFIGQKLPGIVRPTDEVTYRGDEGSEPEAASGSEAMRKHGDEFFIIT